MKRFVHLATPILCTVLTLATRSSFGAEDVVPVAAATTPPASASVASSTEDTVKACKAQIERTVRAPNRARLEKQCERMVTLSGCASEEGRAIQHINFDSQNKREGQSKRILVLGLIHGDEPLAGEMALEWSQRLFTLRDEKKIEARNDWRIVPMLNPDGLYLKTRTNANGIDLNRNFPSRDWETEAPKYFAKLGKEERRNPGDKPASEAETRCAIAQIKDFKPDFIVSVHTPYHVLDFDGPSMAFPKYKDLPWRALGTFPGSLGRFMWRDNSVPVLTVELGLSMIDAAALQDIVGTFAIDAAKRSGTKTAQVFERLNSEKQN